MFHIGSRAIEIQYAWRQEQNPHGDRSSSAFGARVRVSILVGEVPGAKPCCFKRNDEWVREADRRLNKDRGDVAPWRWDLNKAVQLVCWAPELIRQTGDHLNNMERGDKGLASED